MPVHRPDDVDGGWGRPIRRHVRAPGPGSGRPPAGEARLRTGFHPTGPPPPPPGATPPPRPWLQTITAPRAHLTSWLRTAAPRAALELGVAIVALVVLAVSLSPRVPPDVPAARWESSASEVISSLVADASVLESGGSVATGAVARLQRDLRRAHALAVPPSPGLADLWRGSLSHLEQAAALLAQAGSLPQARIELTAGILALVEAGRAARGETAPDG